MDVTTILDVVGRPHYLQHHKYASEGGYDYQSREGTFISAIRAFVKNAGAEVIDEALSYARFWGVERDVADAQSKIAGLQRGRDLVEQDYALSASAPDGKPIRKFAAYNADSTRLAASALFDNRRKLPYEWRKEASTNILARAMQWQAQLPDYLHKALEKSAGYGVPTVEGLWDALDQRATLTHRRYRSELDKLGEFIHMLVGDEESRYQMVKECHTALDVYDRGVGISQHYLTGQLGLPEDTIDDFSVLSVLEKTASSWLPGEVSLINGFSVKPKELDKTALATIDPDLAGLSDSQLVDVLPTLPKGDADLLQRLVS